VGVHTGQRDPWDDDDVPEAAWPYPDSPNQYGFEGTIARFDAFAAGARRTSGARGVFVRVVVGLLLVGLLSGIVAVGAGAVRLLG
jgi:hypothetical protein